MSPKVGRQEEASSTVHRSQFAETEAYRKAVAQQRRKRRRTEAQLERNLNRSDIEEVSGDEEVDPDFCSEGSSNAHLDELRGQERKVRKEEGKRDEKQRENISSGTFDPLLKRAFRV